MNRFEILVGDCQVMMEKHIGIDLNPEYAEMGRQRIDATAPLFNVHAGKSK